MSQLNFSIHAPKPAVRRKTYNPRGKVSFGYRSLILNLVSMTAVMAVVFAVVWYF